MNYLSLVFLFILITQTTTTPTVRYKAINDECLTSYNIDAVENGVKNGVEVIDTQTSDFEATFFLDRSANKNLADSAMVCHHNNRILAETFDEKHARLMKTLKIPSDSKMHVGLTFYVAMSAWFIASKEVPYTPRSDGVFSIKNPDWRDNIGDDHPCLMLQIKENFEDSRLVVESCALKADYTLCEAKISFALKLYKKSTASYEEARALCEENESELVVEAAKSDYAPIFDYFNLPPNSNLLLGYRWSDTNSAFENAETGIKFHESTQNLFSEVPEGSAGQCMFLQTGDAIQDLKVITRQCDSSNNYVVCQKYKHDYQFEVYTTEPLNFDQTLQYCKDQNEYMLSASTINRHYFKSFEKLNLSGTTIFLGFKYFNSWSDGNNPIDRDVFKFKSYRTGTTRDVLALELSSNIEDSKIIIVDKSATYGTVVCQKHITVTDAA